MNEEYSVGYAEGYQTGRNEAIDELEQENRLLRARNDRLQVLVGSQPTKEQIIAGAKALGKRSAEACEIDESDQWKVYSEELIEDARVVLTAAFNAG